MNMRGYRGYLAVLGSFLMHFSLGTVYTFANVSIYIVSYMHFYDSVYIIGNRRA